MSLAAILVFLLSAAYFGFAWYIIKSPRFPNLVWPVFTAIWMLMISSLTELIVPFLPVDDQLKALAYSRVLELAALIFWAHALTKYKTEVKP